MNGRNCVNAFLVLLPPPTTLYICPMSQVIPIGSDHAGFEMKERVKAELARLGYELLDQEAG